MRAIHWFGLFLTVSSLTFSCSQKSNAPDTPLTFNGSSAELGLTDVVPTLDTQIPNGKSAIWCASFQSAWKALGVLAGEPIAFDESNEVANRLNDATDPRPHIPPTTLYVATGWNQEGIANRIQSDLKQRFPNKQPPTFPGILPESFVAYAYLEANVKFSLPYDQNRRPLVFTQGDGRKIQIHAFGISSENHAGSDKLWNQPCVLFRKGESREDNLEFAIDLCSNSFPSQIVVARIAREPSLAAALARVDKEIAGTQEFSGLEAMRLHRIQSTDTLLVPDLSWAISHHFSQVEGRSFGNQKLKGQRLDVAQQDILFRLDRSGAAVRSESKAYAAGVPTDFFLDRPFLVYMKKRGAQMPYFAMWVENAELLRLWQAEGDHPSPENSTKQQ